MKHKRNTHDKSSPRRNRLCFFASVCLAFQLLTGCAATIWDQVDPEYDKLLGAARTDCRGNEVVGVWVSRTPGRIGLPPMRFTMLFKPDGTGRTRRDGKDLGDFTWSYAGKGTWSGTPKNVVPGMIGPDQQILPFTIKYSGRSLLVDSPFYGGLFALGSVITSHVVFVPGDDEAAMEQSLRKQY